MLCLHAGAKPSEVRGAHSVMHVGHTQPSYSHTRGKINSALRARRTPRIVCHNVSPKYAVIKSAPRGDGMRSVHPSAENDLPPMFRRSTSTITSGVASTNRSGEVIITPRMKRVMRRTCPSHSARVIVHGVVGLEPSSICAD